MTGNRVALGRIMPEFPLPLNSPEPGQDRPGDILCRALRKTADRERNRGAGLPLVCNSYADIALCCCGLRNLKVDLSGRDIEQTGRRTAAATGVQAVYVPPDTTDASAPQDVRAGMGAHFRLPIHSLHWEKSRELPIGKYPLMYIYLADMDGTTFWEADLR